MFIYDVKENNQEKKSKCLLMLWEKTIKNYGRGCSLFRVIPAIAYLCCLGDESLARLSRP